MLNENHGDRMKWIQSKGRACPLLKKPCAEDKCALYTQVTMTTVGQLGFPQAEAFETCAWLALLMVSGSKPVIQQVPVKGKQLPNMPIM